MMSIIKVLVIACCYTPRLEALRDQAEISLHEYSEDMNQHFQEEVCARACYTMSEEEFWKLAANPAALMAKADEKCSLPSCKGCKRSRQDPHATTMPNCAAPTVFSEAVQPPPVESTTVLPQLEVAESKPVHSAELNTELSKAAPMETHSEIVTTPPKLDESDPCALQAQTGETCSYATSAWCPQPSRNPGQKYRTSKGPCCCSTR